MSFLQFVFEIMQTSRVNLDDFGIPFESRTDVDIFLYQTHVHEIEHPQVDLVFVDGCSYI